MKAMGLVLACAFCSVALAAPPAAPHLSVQATDIRQLEFSYEPVPAVTRYELWFRTQPGTQAVKYAERDPRRAPFFRIGVPVHLLNWKQAQYYVNACNSSGCTPSNVVGVDGEQLVAMGYIKPSRATGILFFGTSIALSADGKTLAVLMSHNWAGISAAPWCTCIARPRRRRAGAVRRSCCRTSCSRAHRISVPQTPSRCLATGICSCLATGSRVCLDLSRWMET